MYLSFSLLPKPVQLVHDPDSLSNQNYGGGVSHSDGCGISSTPMVSFTLQLEQATIRKEPPTYGQRKGWVPRALEDYGDGGAFPEIHIAQYPLNMGKKTGGGAVRGRRDSN